VVYSRGHHVTIIQQNVGEETRTTLDVGKLGHKYYVVGANVLGWLRKGG